MKQLHESLSLDSSWTDKSSLLTAIVLVKINDSSSESPIITHSLTVKSDLTWSLIVHGVSVDSGSCSCLSSIPTTLTNESFLSLISVLEHSCVCPGHPDERFISMIEAKKGRLLSRDKSEASHIDNFAPVSIDDKVYYKTVRCSGCELLVHKGKCSACIHYRGTLRKIYHRWQKQKSLSPTCRESANSHTNFSLLTTPEKNKRYNNLRIRLKSTKREVKKLKEIIDMNNKKDGIIVNEDIHSDLESIMIEMSPKVKEDNPMDSFRRVFWEHQLEALRLKDKRQIRWPPAIIKWCLHLKFLSGGAYHALRSSFLVLPSERTLRDYTHFIQAGIGFLSDVSVQMIKEAKIESVKDTHVVLMWDEMKIKGDLCFNKYTCELIGFTNIGDINNQLDQFEQQCVNPSSMTRTVASHMLVFMVRGIFTSLEFPYAQFPTTGITADSLFPLVWEAVYNLESCGFKVVAFACDGATPNRKFFAMHGGNKKLIYKTTNIYSDDPKDEIYFFSDVPHLLKTTRNCWSNSFAHRWSRALWVSIFV